MVNKVTGRTRVLVSSLRGTKGSRRDHRIEWTRVMVSNLTGTKESQIGNPIEWTGITVNNLTEWTRITASNLIGTKETQIDNLTGSTSFRYSWTDSRILIGSKFLFQGTNLVPILPP